MHLLSNSVANTYRVRSGQWRRRLSGCILVVQPTRPDELFHCLSLEIVPCSSCAWAPKKELNTQQNAGYAYRLIGNHSRGVLQPIANAPAAAGQLHCPPHPLVQLAVIMNMAEGIYCPADPYVLPIVMGSCLAKELYVDNGEKFHINNALITLNGSDRIGSVAAAAVVAAVPASAASAAVTILKHP